MSMLQEDKQLTEIPVAELMISSEKVAHVQVNNPSEHALLVLVKSGYSAIPVLDSTYKLLGIIGKSAILNQIFGLERIEMEKLSSIRVQEVMTKDIPTLSREDSLLDGLNALINHAFVCVVDEDGFFDGILTRRALLKHLKKEIYTSKFLKK
ncbi:cyclic-di-AMP-binding protein CbpB [Oceanobacillus bengalensis]|uniref:CBS domain-containing protein n=1 Tax=Oceanobacillus bengalensis TaxID=1435466 RepID=A0A494Z1G0_9BACI|nr:cyclic-di-AMP-binding protein CbpB [Oceanobacillus bengalensis]RKQ16366.1 CBS domain-containing protein [Oceanobacillus bengalensis]